MTDLTVRTLEASTKSIPQDPVAALRGRLRGTVALPGEDGYDAARIIWNAMVDRRPGLVVRCLGTADVINAVKLARDEKLLVEACVPVALSGEFFVSVSNVRPSQAFRSTGDNVLPARSIAASAFANSDSTTRRRLSLTPGSITSNAASFAFHFCTWSRHSLMTPSPLDRPLLI